MAISEANKHKKWIKAVGWCLWGMLLALALWRVGLSVKILTNPTMLTGQGAVVVVWRRLEPLVGWIGLLMLWIGVEGKGWRGRSLKEERLGVVFAVILGLGMGISLLAIGLDQLDFGGNQVAWVADGWLVLAGVMVVLREWRGLVGEMKGGVTVLHLWRLAGVQWALAWLGAVAYLRVMKPADLLGNEGVRGLIFAMPAVGLMGNLLMGSGVGWESENQGGGGEKKPLWRAWVVAAGLVNLGAVLLVVKPGVWGLGMLGGGMVGVAVLLYLLGFPGGFLKWPVVVGWGMLMVGMGMMGVERVMGAASGGGIAWAFWGAAWRHLVGVGWVGMWVFGMKNRVSRVFAGVFGVGVGVTVAVLVGAAFVVGEGQGRVLAWLVVGTGLEVAGLLALGPGMGLVGRYKVMENDAE